jgi:hypothetical protein
LTESQKICSKFENLFLTHINTIMESSKTGHSIAGRTTANDVFITPIPLVKKQIEMIQHYEADRWLDAFYGTGNYYNQFPTDNKDFCEIAEPYEKDFLTYEGDVDIICSNPPYSIINPILKKCVELKPRVISLLIGQGNLTTKRIEFMNDNGYGLAKLRMLKVHQWYGFSYIVQFEKDKENVIEIDRTIYHDENK